MYIGIQTMYRLNDELWHTKPCIPLLLLLLLLSVVVLKVGLPERQIITVLAAPWPVQLVRNRMGQPVECFLFDL